MFVCVFAKYVLAEVLLEQLLFDILYPVTAAGLHMVHVTTIYGVIPLHFVIPPHYPTTLVASAKPLRLY